MNSKKLFTFDEFKKAMDGLKSKKEFHVDAKHMKLSSNNLDMNQKI